MPILRRSRRRREEDEGSDEPRFLVVGLGNPGRRYAATRHNVGAMVVAELARRWDLPRPRERFRGLISEGRIRRGVAELWAHDATRPRQPRGPRVATLVPQTYMNESGRSVGPARGALRVPLDRLVVVYDEIDLPFGEVRSKLGGGAAGHNGIRSLIDGLGGGDFWRVRVGVGRPDSTDPEIVSAYVLGRFREPDAEVRDLIAAAADETERLVERLAEPSTPAGPASAT